MREYRLIRSARRTMSLEVGADGAVTVRAPLRLSQRQVDAFVAAHEEWLREKLAAAERRRQDATPPPTPEETEALVRAARERLPGRVEYWAQRTGLAPTGVRITRAKTRYGSCSPKNSLCFSCYLMRRSADEIDYVIVHELAHIAEKNHGACFYALIERYLPDYRQRIKTLKTQ